MSKSLGFKIKRIPGHKPVHSSGGLMCEVNGIRTYFIDLGEKHCEVYASCDDYLFVKYPADETFGCTFHFDVPKGYIMLAEINRYTLVVRMIPKIPDGQKMRQINRKGKTNSFVVTNIYQ